MRLSEAVSESFLHDCVTNGLILDTNVFLLAFTSVEADEDERRIVKSIVGYCGSRRGKIILTPHILAEITNLTINRPRVGIISNDVTRIIFVLNHKVKEHYSTKEQIMQHPSFSRFGFADLSVLEACKCFHCGVLTDDGLLCAKLLDSGCSAMNSKTLRERRLIMDLYSA